MKKNKTQLLEIIYDPKNIADKAILDKLAFMEDAIVIKVTKALKPYDVLFLIKQHNIKSIKFVLLAQNKDHGYTEEEKIQLINIQEAITMDLNITHDVFVEYVDDIKILDPIKDKILRIVMVDSEIVTTINNHQEIKDKFKEDYMTILVTSINEKIYTDILAEMVNNNITALQLIQLNHDFRNQQCVEIQDRLYKNMMKTTLDSLSNMIDRLGNVMVERQEYILNGEGDIVLC